MATLTSQEILNATVSMGVSKANQCWIARAANTLLAGMYIAIGGFLAIRIGLALPWEQWGGMSKLIFGAVFPLGLMLVVLCGADLFTGSCMTLTTAQAKQKISFGQTVFTLATSWLGNFAGALFVAFFIAYLSGLIFESAGGTMPWAAAVVNLANAKCSLGFTGGRLNGNDRQDRGSLVPDDGFRCLGHGALHCQYVFHSARNPDRNRSPLHRISRSREGRST